MALTRIKLTQFTAFDEMNLGISPGINIFIGENGTGKTHLMKVAYAACDVSKTKINFAEKLIGVFLPSERALGRLVKRQSRSSHAIVQVTQDKVTLKLSFSNHAKSSLQAELTGALRWQALELESVYIPVKEMLSNAPGFRSLYSQREIHFEEIYADILDRAYRPALRGPTDAARKRLLENLQATMEGKVILKNEEFFLKNQRGNLEFTLLAEGLRKLALLWLLIQNGTLLKGSVLFWDEPETNLNPSLFRPLVQLLLELQRIGVQVFLATHDYVILKELDLGRQSSDQILYHSLFRNLAGIQYHASESYVGLHPNTIQDTFLSLYDRDVARDLAE